MKSLNLGFILLVVLGSLAPVMGQAITRNGSQYSLVAIQSVADARAQAAAMGGHLVTIESAAENQFLLDTFRNDWSQGTKDPLIGLTDVQTEGRWDWDSGSTSTYTNWRRNEPNNVGNEDYTVFRMWDGLWNDVGEAYNQGGRAIIEVPVGPRTATRNGKTYTLITIQGIDDARAQATALGGKLVTIESAEENQFLVDSFHNFFTHGDTDPVIGLSDAQAEGQWAWESLSGTTYTNWYPNEPNNLGNEDYVILRMYDGLWNDIPASTTGGRRAIVEVMDRPAMVAETRVMECTSGGGGDGYGFTVDRVVKVTELGRLDEGAPGLTFASTVSLHRPIDQRQLASVQIPAGQGGRAQRGFRYMPITPVYLYPGYLYVITASYQRRSLGVNYTDEKRYYVREGNWQPWIIPGERMGSTGERPHSPFGSGGESPVIGPNMISYDATGTNPPSDGGIARQSGVFHYANATERRGQATHTNAPATEIANHVELTPGTEGAGLAIVNGPSHLGAISDFTLSFSLGVFPTNDQPSTAVTSYAGVHITDQGTALPQNPTHANTLGNASGLTLGTTQLTSGNWIVHLSYNGQLLGMNTIFTDLTRGYHRFWITKEGDNVVVEFQKHAAWTVWSEDPGFEVYVAPGPRRTVLMHHVPQFTPVVPKFAFFGANSSASNTWYYVDHFYLTVYGQ